MSYFCFPIFPCRILFHKIYIHIYYNVSNAIWTLATCKGTFMPNHYTTHYFYKTLSLNHLHSNCTRITCAWKSSVYVYIYIYLIYLKLSCFCFLSSLKFFQFFLSCLPHKQEAILLSTTRKPRKIHYYPQNHR